MYEASAAHLRALRQAAPNAEILLAHDEPGAARLIEQADAVLGNRFFLQSLPHARRLRWMQSGSMGVDRILAAGADLGDLVLTCARGAYDDEVAEHGVALALALLRGLHLARDEQRAQAWQRRPLRTAAGSHALVLGWGGVGRGMAQRLRALGAEVQGARQRLNGPPAADASGFVVHGPATWREALAWADLLAMALPLTAATRRLVGKRELDCLPAGALVINVGRGGTLDDDALLEQIQAGRLGGAGLDVLEQEPPPPGHAMWSEPRVLLTPHEARGLESPPYRWEPLFVENLRRFASGEPLLHVVDRAAGY